jgi:hypothetical protein
MKNLRHDSQYPGRDSNTAPPEYKSKALPVDQSIRYACRNDCTGDSFLRHVSSGAAIRGNKIVIHSETFNTVPRNVRMHHFSIDYIREVSSSEIHDDSKLLSVFPCLINGNPDNNLESLCI